MREKARHLFDARNQLTDENLATGTHLMRDFLGLLIPEAERRFGRFAPAGIEEARRRLAANEAVHASRL
ncbi:DUF6415 family natural product biosynthesis protein [Streptomyces sp. NPDC059568]|uniref:DUF6415 family natural product biosynthesis protein n=1 Tax=Streptomyces sp. NPDC059568 TaxID=3346868 RepID=UPI0036B84688